jgi:hypothetical protein
VNWKPRNGTDIFKSEKGESLFTEPCAAFGTSAAETAIPSYQIIENAKDHRSKVILSALVIETNLDSLLEAWMPGYKDLVEKKEFTFSLKIEILRAMRLMPPHIVDAADVLRDVRNQFAHHLEVDSLDNLHQKYEGRLSGLHSRIFGTASKTIVEKFDDLAKLAIQGFRAYAGNIRLLRKALETDDYVNSVLEAEKAKQADSLKKILDSVPLTTLTVGASSVAVYPEGVTVVTDPTTQKS